MKIVVKVIAVLAHAQVQLLLTRVAERWMPDVVYQGKRFGQVGVEAQGAGDSARDLRDFDGVSEAIAKVVGVACGEDLGLGFQTTKGAGVDYAVAVAGIIAAVGMLRLGIATAARTP